MTPPALDHVVRKCLEKDPDDRWQSAHDVASELRWIGEAGSQAGVPATLSLRRRSRERLAWGLAAAARGAPRRLGASAAASPRAGPAAAFRATLDPPPDTALIPFDELGLPLSPDGRQLAFVAIRRRRQQADLGPRPLRRWRRARCPRPRGPGTRSGRPTGSSLGFFADGKLKRIDLRGGVAAGDRRRAVRPRRELGPRRRHPLLAEHPRGDPQRPGRGRGTPAPVTRFDPEKETTHRWPHFLPDGRHFLYMLRVRGCPASPRSAGSCSASLDSPEAAAADRRRDERRLRRAGVPALRAVGRTSTRGASTRSSCG